MITAPNAPTAYHRVARWLVERGVWQIAEGLAGLVHGRFVRARLRQVVATAYFTAALLVEAIGDAVTGGGR